MNYLQQSCEVSYVIPSEVEESSPSGEDSSTLPDVHRGSVGMTTE